MTIRIKARGCAQVRLTHEKTIEITTDTQLTDRGTCIAGIEAVYDVDILRGLRGTTEVRFLVSGEEFRFSGQVNPDFCSDEKIIFRKSAFCDRHTLLVHCDRAADEVPKSIVEALKMEVPFQIEIEDEGPATEDSFRQRAPYREGALYLLGQSIGNWDDVSPRCLRMLQEVDLVAAEDTRKLVRLLRHHGISAKKVESYHDFTHENARERLVRTMVDGGTVALVSDAGVPAIADPGYKLIVDARRHGVAVVPIPGANAAITALVASGLPTDAFSFFGFLPRAGGARKAKLLSLKDRHETLVFYESTHRIHASLETALEALGDRDACLARELTKDHEEFLRGTLSEILDELRSRVAIRGEITLVISGSVDHDPDEEAIKAAARDLLVQGIHPKEIRDSLSQEFQVPKRVIYKMVLELRKDPEL